MKPRTKPRKPSNPFWRELRRLSSRKVELKTREPRQKIKVNLKKDKMPLNIRIFKCDNCGLEINRDLNAAINLKNNTIGTMEINARGDTTTGDLATAGSRHVSSKQEKFKVSAND